MATICKPPDKLSFVGNTAQNWQEFEEQLRWFLAGTESAEKSDLTKIGIMLSHAGKEAREVYKTLQWDSEGDQNKFNKVIEAFQKYCSPRKNILYERYGFWSLHQEDDESIDAYLTRIKIKIDMCEYTKEGWPQAVRQELTRDKFVFGLIDDTLKERLLREANLDLNRAVEIAQRTESSKRQVKEMATRSSVNILQQSSERQLVNNSQVFNCGQCGCQHKPKKCPAYGQECTFCNKMNHFARMCRNKRARERNIQQKRQQSANTQFRSQTNRRVHDVEQSDTSSNTSTEESPDLMVTPLQIEGIKKSSAWFANLSTNGGKLTCKLDTGAEVSVLPLHTYNKLDTKPTLKSTSMNLTAYGGSSIKPSGTCKLTCSNQAKGNTCEVKFYVTPVDAHPILGLTDCIQLGLIKRVCEIQQEGLTKDMLKQKYPMVFKGLGKLGMYHITLQDNHTPVINPPRRIPHSLKSRLQQSLEKNVRLGVLKKVDQPTDWVSNLVIVEKKDGSLRLCLDPKDLNKAIKREHYKIPTMEEIASEFAGKRVFSTLDLKDGYWQVQLDEESSLLCTFNTPFGRYRFTRMPFGIKSASEVFQKKNEEAFAGIPGIYIVSDDIIIAAETIQEHDEILIQVLNRAKEQNITLNFDKVHLRASEVKYLGTIITHQGMKPDPSKVKAIVEMTTPTDKPGIRRLLGMINFLAPHIPSMSTITAPLRDLLKSDIHFTWGPEQTTAMTKVKEILSTSPVLSYFDPSAKSTIQADASQFGLGACLLQKGKPIAYASRSLLPAECNYAQIEKELLAIVFACHKFHQYIYGFHTKIQTDHKPLESIFKKSLHKASPRLQRMLLKLQKYDLSIGYTKGKDLYIADTLSRAYLTASSDDTDHEDIELAVHTMIQNLPVSDAKLTQLQSATESDEQLQQLSTMIRNGWPNNISNVPMILREYWKVKHKLHVADKLIFVNNRIVIPSCMRTEILKCIHTGHMGIEKSKARARVCVYWPKMYEAIEYEVKKCSVCNKYSLQNQKEPMLPHPVPNRPWEKLGADYFTLAGKDYLLVVDYFSKFPEVIQMDSKTAEATITTMKDIFARHGIPNTVVADNMPFNSRPFKQFAKDWNFAITTSSPGYPQSNGLVERNVQSIKRLIKKAREDGKDEEMALLEFRNTPITGLQESPAQLLMNRRLRSILPMTTVLLEPQISRGTKEKLKQRQTNQKHLYDRGARPLSDLKPNDTIRYKRNKSWEQAVVIDRHSSPRSYNIRTAEGTTLRRNRRQLKKTSESPPTGTTAIMDDDIVDVVTDLSPSLSSPQSVEMTQGNVTSERRTRSGRVIRPPSRYRDD